MTRLILSALLAFAAAPCFAQGDATFKVPYDDNKNLASSLSFVGARVSSSSSVGNSTTDTDKLWFTGEGIFYGVEMSAGASASSYVVCFDTGAVLSSNVSETKATWLMGKCLASASAAVQCGGATGANNVPRHFKRGLYCYCLTSGNTAQHYIPLYRKARE